MQKSLDRLLTGLAWLSAGSTLLAVLLLLVFLMSHGMPGIDAALFFGDTPWLDALLGRKPIFGGIWPALVGTFSLVFLASVFSIPLGIASGIYQIGRASCRERV